MIPSLAGRLAQLCAHHPFRTLLAAALLTVLALFVVAERLRISADPGDLVPPDLPFMQAYAAWKQAMPQLRRGSIVVIDGPTPEAAAEAQDRLAEAMEARPELFRGLFVPGRQDVFARAAPLFLQLDALQELTDRLAEAQPMLAALAARPDLAGLAEARDLLGEDCAVAGPVDAMLAEAARATLAGAPPAWSWQRLLLGDSAPPARRLILYRGALDDRDAAVSRQATAALKRFAAELRLLPEAGFLLRSTGRGILADEEVAGALSDLTWTSAVSLALVILVLALGLGGFGRLAAGMATLAVGLALTAGAAALLFGTLNLLSAAFAVMFVGLGIDFVVHVLLRRQEGAARAEGIAVTARETSVPLGLCALTSALGFLAFVPTAYQGLAQLGVVAAIGLGLAFATAYTVLPAALALLDRAPRGGSAADRRLDRGLRAVVLAAPPRSTAVAIVLAAAVALPFALDLRFDFNTLNLQDPNAPSVGALRDLQADRFATPRALFVLAADRTEAEAVAEALRPLPGVADVRTVHDLVPREQAAKRAVLEEAGLFLWPVFETAPAPPPDAAAARAALLRLADAARCGDTGAALRRLAAAGERPVAAFQAQVTGGLPALFAELRQMLEAGPVALADLPAGLVERETAADGRLNVSILPAADPTDSAALARFVADVTARFPAATGQPALEAGVGQVVTEAFGQALGYALAAVVVALAVLLRRPREVALALLPLLLAGALTAATARLAGIPFNYANVLVIPLLLGLGVDYGIHMVARWRAAGGVGQLFATSTPRAIVLSGLTTLCSFGTLAFVGSRAIASLGLLLAAAMLWVLVATVLALPPVLRLFGDRREAGESDRDKR